MDAVIELEIPARAEYVALARLVVSSLASSRRDLTDDRIDDLKVAVSEACTNAIEAHREAGTGENIVLRCEEYEERIVVVIEDSGRGFDPSSLPEHPPVTDPQRLNFERGLGIPLIRTLVDAVDIESSSAGTSVRMTMRCGPAPLAEEIDFDLGDIDGFAPAGDGDGAS